MESFYGHNNPSRFGIQGFLVLSCLAPALVTARSWRGKPPERQTNIRSSPLTCTAACTLTIPYQAAHGGAGRLTVKS